MNNDVFKKFIGPYLVDAFDANGGIDIVREMHAVMSMTSFISGFVCGMVVQHASQRGTIAAWRSPDVLRESAGFRHFTMEEMRRVLDLVRLRLDTESTTS